MCYCWFYHHFCLVFLSFFQYQRISLIINCKFVNFGKFYTIETVATLMWCGVMQYYLVLLFNSVRFAVFISPSISIADAITLPFHLQIYTSSSSSFTLYFSVFMLSFVSILSSSHARVPTFSSPKRYLCGLFECVCVFVFFLLLHVFFFHFSVYTDKLLHMDVCNVLFIYVCICVLGVWIRGGANTNKNTELIEILVVWLFPLFLLFQFSLSLSLFLFLTLLDKMHYVKIHS